MKVKCSPKNITLNKDKESNKLANASITLDEAFVVGGLTVMNSSKGLFVAMPQRKGMDKEGNVKYYDTSFPLFKELRDMISTAVLNAYEEKVNEQQNAAQQTNSQGNGTPEKSENTSENSEDEEDVPDFY